MILDVVVFLLLVAFTGFPLALAAGSVTVAMLSAPRNRHVRIRRRLLAGGFFLSLFGVLMMVVGAYEAREESRYGVFEWYASMMATLVGGGLLLFGLGPFVSWLLEILDRCAERLPLPVRLAARDLAGRRAVTAPAIAMTMLATACCIALTIIAVGVTAMNRADYLPQARPGTFLVDQYAVENTDAVRAAIQRELPGVPLTQREMPILPSGEHRHFSADARNVYQSDEAVYPNEVIGDERLLRYLTGDRSTPYDEGTAVVVTTAAVRVDSVRIFYGVNENDVPMTSRTIPAVVARTVDPHMETIFVPSKVVRDIGYHLTPGALIVDPSVRRVSAEEQERLDGQLGDVANVHVERGFQASTGWTVGTAVALLVALGGALAAGGGKATGSRPGRVLRRAGHGSAAAFRWFGASRTGLSALCGTVLGAVAGCPIGMSLFWPWTASTTWDAPSRVPFDIPWLTIAAVVAGLPVLAAALGGLLARRRSTC